MFEIGTSLREARLRQGLELPELEQTTKIRSKYLRALEEEQFQSLPAQTYVKGFLRNYAEALGLDGQLYVDEYNSRYVTGEEEPPPRPRRSTARPPAHRRLEARAVLVGVSSIAAVLALFFVAWKFGGTEPSRVVGVNETAPSVPAADRQPERTPAAPVTQARPRPAPVARLVVTAANGRCWLQVRSGSALGEQLFQGTLEYGQTLPPFVARRLWVNIGAPGNVVLRLNGRARPLPGSGSPRVLLVTPTRITEAATAA